MKNLLSIVKRKYLETTIAMMVVFFNSSMQVFASAIAVDEKLKIDWPWTKFFDALAAELTGPLPMTLGMLGIAGAAIAMFSGHAGGGTQKFIMLIFVVSICLFAPNFIGFIKESANGLTILGVM